jgi:diguanylate cyclase
MLGRIGGEEFALILPETNSEQAAQVIKRILAEVLGGHFRYGNDKINLSFSAGIAQFSDTGTVDELIKCADEALYRSKAAGRARVLVHAVSG